MTTKQKKEWNKLVKLFKDEAKKRYRAGDLVPAPDSSSADHYRIKTRSTYQVIFCEARNYERSSILVTVGHHNGMVTDVFDSDYYAGWIFPENIKLSELNERCGRDWFVRDELKEAFSNFLKM